ncbi:MAG: hypothetical protein KF678_04515 [Phycisphaeraceae bacterium]|nr:hypothetical protein [Phycisphaeraceae bacterium]
MLSAAIASAALALRADIIYQTNPPYFGPNGPPAFDIMDFQSVALRFTPRRDFTLETVRVWIMSNDLTQPPQAPIRLEVRDANPDGRPGEFIIASTSFHATAIGWNPVLETVPIRAHPLLRAHTDYWLILHCDLHVNTPAWNWSDGSIGIIALSHGGQTNFTEGGEGAVTGTTIEGSPACYTNCDGSTATPVLSANDFVCFLNKFASADPYANCDGSTGSPLLTANDFQCFINRFVTGCP